MDLVIRSEENPILFPNKANSWEAEAVFNGCPVKKGNTIHLLYRALSAVHYHAGTGTQMSISDIGKATSSDGIHFKKRERFIFPEEPWEKFGCEDPRVTRLNGKYYIFYTALSAHPPGADSIKIGLAISKDLKKISSKHLVTPFNAKAMALFPEKIKGKMAAILTANTDRPPAKIGLAFFNNESDLWNKNYWDEWYGDLESHTLPLQRRPEDHIEVGAPPVKTKDGWLVFYSYIRNYFTNQEKTFGVEAVLLDLEDPHKIIGRTISPILIPEEQYEIYGMVPNIVFPTGVLMKNDKWVDLYYGAADSTVCVASINLKRLMIEMKPGSSKIVRLERSLKNPILTPRTNNAWEAKAVFNPAAILLNGEVHILYRAMSESNTSVMGYARSRDGICITERSLKPAYVPTKDFERKGVPNGNSGCEDPRLTKIGSRIYMCYTAYNGLEAPRVALTSITDKDFLAKKWTWSSPILISPPGHDNKDACIFPQKIGNKYLIFHRMGYGIDIAFVNNLDSFKEVWLEERQWLEPRDGYWDSLKVGIASPPHKTSKGWLLLYHGVSAEDHQYRVGAVLLDLKNPVIIKGRTRIPIFEPETEYEKNGQVGNVVFPCGSVVIKGTLYVYYGGGDSVVGVATVSVKKLLSIFD
ncbi:MAG: hypothetical protein KGZ30_01135 [Anaplasmataceae bacterium]|nr:hypothetical protein [Anaplasmataceae bacterium]